MVHSYTANGTTTTGLTTGTVASTTVGDECCFYTFILNVITTLLPGTRGPRYEVKEFEISCACDSCSTAEESYHKRYRGHTASGIPWDNPWIGDRYKVVSNCGPCSDCGGLNDLNKPCKISNADASGFELEEGGKGDEGIEGFDKLLRGDGDWDKLEEYIEDWDDAGFIDTPHPNEQCDLPIPSGWLRVADQPANLYDLDCCK